MRDSQKTIYFAQLSMYFPFEKWGIKWDEIEIIEIGNKLIYISTQLIEDIDKIILFFYNIPNLCNYISLNQIIDLYIRGKSFFKIDYKEILISIMEKKSIDDEIISKISNSIDTINSYLDIKKILGDFYE